jgi:hypothetical protein
MRTIRHLQRQARDEHNENRKKWMAFSTGRLNRTRVLQTCRSDGTLLKPHAPGETTQTNSPFLVFSCEDACENDRRWPRRQARGVSGQQKVATFDQRFFRLAIYI